MKTGQVIFNLIFGFFCIVNASGLYAVEARRMGVNDDGQASVLTVFEVPTGTEHVFYNSKLNYHSTDFKSEYVVVVKKQTSVEHQLCHRTQEAYSCELIGESYGEEEYSQLMQNLEEQFNDEREKGLSYGFLGGSLVGAGGLFLAAAVCSLSKGKNRLCRQLIDPESSPGKFGNAFAGGLGGGTIGGSVGLIYDSAKNKEVYTKYALPKANVLAPSESKQIGFTGLYYLDDFVVQLSEMNLNRDQILNSAQ